MIYISLVYILQKAIHDISGFKKTAWEMIPVTNTNLLPISLKTTTSSKKKMLIIIYLK